jgi:hypothetical protein
METRVLTKNEAEFCRLNCFLFDAIFRFHNKAHCSNAECNYPLDTTEPAFFSHELNGRICDLCHVLDDAARQQPGLREAHEKWKAEQAAKKKILDTRNYF